MRARIYLPKNRNLSKILLLDDECVAARDYSRCSPRCLVTKMRERVRSLPCLTTAYASRRFRLEETRNPAIEGARTRGKHALVEELYAGGRLLSTVDYKKKCPRFITLSSDDCWIKFLRAYTDRSAYNSLIYCNNHFIWKFFNI